jgi:hypothetical protein
MAIIRQKKNVSQPLGKPAEIDIAAVVITWLAEADWTIYQEVQIGRYGPRIDLVARMGERLWVIECKRTHSFDVIEQTLRWVGAAHWISIATAGRLRKTLARERFHEMLGVGWLHCGGGITEVVAAPLHRRLGSFDLRHYLKDGQRTTGTAGSQSDYWSSFRQTKGQVIELVQKSPGITMKDLVDRAGGFHYSSSSTARAALAKWISRGTIPGIESRREGRLVRYYPQASAGDCSAATDRSTP